MFISVYFYRKHFLQLLWENDHDGIRAAFPSCFPSKILQLQLQNVLVFTLLGFFPFPRMTPNKTDFHIAVLW